ncbi:hypothetical protein NL676_030775 [Syzygium grande]|nr:hypothetical protein NL676_030775 [Syzygium grande]
MEQARERGVRFSDPRGGLSRFRDPISIRVSAPTVGLRRGRTKTPIRTSSRRHGRRPLPRSEGMRDPHPRSAQFLARRFHDLSRTSSIHKNPDSDLPFNIHLPPYTWGCKMAWDNLSHRICSRPNNGQ